MLVERSIDGDLNAFRSLMESQQTYAYVLAFRLLRDEDDAEDVVQEAFIRVWKNLARYRPEVKFTTWLYRIVVNLCYDKIKMEARRRSIVVYFRNLINRGELADGRDLPKESEDRDLSEQILLAARRLPPIQHLVFHLRDVQDLSIAEVAEVAGISVGSVKTNLCYARKSIRAAMTHHHGGEKP